MKIIVSQSKAPGKQILAIWRKKSINLRLTALAIVKISQNSTAQKKNLFQSTKLFCGFSKLQWRITRRKNPLEKSKAKREVKHFWIESFHQSFTLFSIIYKLFILPTHWFHTQACLFLPRCARDSPRELENRRKHASTENYCIQRALNNMRKQWSFMQKIWFHAKKKNTQLSIFYC